MWPVYSGDRAQDTLVNCFVYDEVHEFVIVGGTSTDSTNTNAPISTGFAYALDLEGNWMWSNTFYN